MASGDLIVRVASQDTLLKVEDLVNKIAYSVVDASKIDWKALFSARATGEVYSTKFYTYENSTNPSGERMNASVGLKCEPSTESFKGRDDFSLRNAFSFIDCNFICDDNGVKKPSKIVGQSGFSYTGKVDVGILTPQTYWAIEEHYSDGYYIVHFSDKKHEELNMVSTPWCNDPSGNEMGYGIVTKYYAGMIDGTLYSSSGIAPEGFMSYKSAHELLQNKGAGYYGSGSERSAYLLCMLWIKYATKNSQTVFDGFTVNNQYKVAEVTSNCDYFIVRGYFRNGECVSIGDPGSNTNLDRNNDYMHNILYRVRVKRIEQIPGERGKYKVYVTGGTFSTTSTTMISSEPCYSGETDNVLGSDGYVRGNSSYSFKLNGVEDGIGAWFISMNELCYKENQTLTSYYVRGNAEWSNSDISRYTKVGTFDLGDDSAWIGDLTMDVKTGVFYPRVYGSSSNTGVGDRQYPGGIGPAFKSVYHGGYLELTNNLSGLACSILGDATDYAFTKSYNYSVVV